METYENVILNCRQQFYLKQCCILQFMHHLSKNCESDDVLIFCLQIKNQSFRLVFLIVAFFFTDGALSQILIFVFVSLEIFKGTEGQKPFFF